MKESIFRKKSVERISSPEQLTDYIHVTNPAVWMLLVAVSVLLIGVCVWGVFGRLDTKLTVAAESKDGSVICYVKETDIASVSEGMPVIIGDNEYRITALTAQPFSVEKDFSEYALHIGGIAEGEWVYVAGTDADLPDGVYTAEIVIDRVSAASFVLN